MALQLALVRWDKLDQKQATNAFSASHGHFAIRIEPYKNSISCDRSQNPPFASCSSIAQQMPYDYQEQLFGNAGDRRIAVPLPWTRTSYDGKCTVTIDSTELATVARWRDLWTATTALNAKCARAAGKGGKISKLGGSHKMNIRITNGPGLPVLGLPGAQNTTGESSQHSAATA